MHEGPHELRYWDVKLAAQVQQVDGGQHPFGIRVSQNLVSPSIHFNVGSFAENGTPGNDQHIKYI